MSYAFLACWSFDEELYEKMDSTSRGTGTILDARLNTKIWNQRA